jgi:hypothetical protein
MDGIFNITNFKFNKPYFQQSEILELFNISETTLKRYIAECKSAQELGMFKIDGVRQNMFEPKMFLNWLIENKINGPQQYDYQKAEVDNLKTNITKLTRGTN